MERMDHFGCLLSYTTYLQNFEAQIWWGEMETGGQWVVVLVGTSQTPPTWIVIVVRACQVFFWTTMVQVVSIGSLDWCGFFGHTIEKDKHSIISLQMQTTESLIDPDPTAKSHQTRKISKPKSFVSYKMDMSSPAVVEIQKNLYELKW